MRMKNVLIGIQARSTSTRLPRKVFEHIQGKPMLDHVIDACKCAAEYLNNYSARTGIGVQVVLLVPKGDEIVGAWSHRLPIFQGDEQDVLSRYHLAATEMDADYICRITSDCPLLPPYIVSKAIKLAIMNCYDYVSNVDPRFRTALDGQDVEVFSRKMVDWAMEHAKPGPEREHVTMICRDRPPEWARIGAIVGFFDQSDVKLSVDSAAELASVRRQFDSVQRKAKLAEKHYGRNGVHRF